MIFSLLLVLLGFLAAQEMFGTGAGFIALALLVFDLNLLLMVRLSAPSGPYLFHVRCHLCVRSLRKDTVGVASSRCGTSYRAGAGSKYTGILVFPML